MVPKQVQSREKVVSSGSLSLRFRQWILFMLSSLGHAIVWYREQQTQSIRRAKETWRGQLAFRLVIFLLAAALILMIVRSAVRFMMPERERLWAVDTLDATVITGLAFAIVAAIVVTLTLLFPRSTSVRRFRTDLITWAGAAVLILTFFAGYASFRNQGRLASEAALNDAGYDLFNIEMSNEGIRCLYFNYGYDRPRECLENIVIDSKSWSLALFYVEESWFQLANAQDEREEWGATYAEEIRYWAQDVSRDPTGLFAYYLVSSENSLENARATMEAADVSINNLCLRYRIVWRALRRRAAQPSRVSRAAKECGRLPPIDPSIMGAATLTIADD